MFLDIFNPPSNPTVKAASRVTVLSMTQASSSSLALQVAIFPAVGTTTAQITTTVSSSASQRKVADALKIYVVAPSGSSSDPVVTLGTASTLVFSGRCQNNKVDPNGETDVDCGGGVATG